MSLRVASYNIHRAIGRDGREDASRIAQVLEEVDADIVALQEVGYARGTPGNVLEYLGERLNAQVVEGVTLQDERGHYGNAVLSRLPVASLSRHDISVPHREPRGALELTFHLGQAEILLIATHLGLLPGERRYQIRKLLPLVDASPADVKILLGDLNEWFLWGRLLRWLRRDFGRVAAPRTFPAHRPWFALDRLWVKPTGAVQTLRAHRSEMARIASDHLPLVAELTI